MGHASGRADSLARPCLHMAFGADPENLGRVRRALESMNLPDGMLRDAALLTTELVTNSIQHAGLGPDDLIDVTVGWRGTSLRVVVLDPGTGKLPSEVVAGSIRPSPGGQSGWGLYLVDNLASRWGTSLGRTAGFWFEIEGSGGAGRGD